MRRPLTMALLLCLPAAPASPGRAQEPLPAIEALRTPDARFESLPGFLFAPHYAVVPGNLRMHYVDEGPRDAPVVVLLHGLPTWSYLYRGIIPVLTDAGYRVIAPDLIGYGRSDKPVSRADHTYARHVEWVRSLLFDHLALRDVTFFGQDWGGLIGLRVVAENADRFAAVAIGNTGLPTGDTPMPAAYMNWRAMSQAAPSLAAGGLVQSATRAQLPDDVVAAYDAPFPDSTYQAAVRAMPLLVPITPDDAASSANRAAWDRLRSWDRPFITLFSDGDPITRGLDAAFRAEVPGAAGQPHRTIEGGGHFLQEDAGEELAALLLEFVRRTGGR